MPSNEKASKMTWNQRIASPDAFVPRIDLLRKYTVRYINDRFEKYPDDARVELVTFGEQYRHKICHTRRELVASVERLHAHDGYTHYTPGLDFIATEVGKAGHEANHVVIVTDGTGDTVHEELICRYVQQKIVVDVIFISSYDDVHPGLNELARRTGGSVQTVKYGDMFEAKFLSTAARLALPPASAQIEGGA
jgi:hypothetical protein